MLRIGTSTLLLVIAVTSMAFVRGSQAAPPAFDQPNTLPLNDSAAPLAGFVGPHVANNAALSTASLQDYANVTIVRDGFATPSDGGAALYTYSSSACPLSRGNGGTQVPADNGGCWIADPTTPITVELFAGAIGVAPPGSPTISSPDASPALQLALNTGRTVHLGSYRYKVKGCDLITAPSQKIIGQGRWLTRLNYFNDFNTSTCSAVLKTALSIDGGEGPIIRDFMISGLQPDVSPALSTPAQLASLIQVSCIDLRDTLSSQVQHMMLTTCMRGLDLRGETAQTVVDDIQGSNFIALVDIDGAEDTITLNGLHDFPFFLTPNQAKLIQQVGTTINSGRMDDLKISNSLSLASGTAMHFYRGLVRTKAADGYVSAGGSTAGASVDFDFDGSDNIGIQMDSGNVSITGGYFSTRRPILMNNGNLEVSNTSMGISQDGAVTLNNGYLTLTSSQIFDVNNDYTGIIQNSGMMVFSNNLYAWGSSGNITKPKINAICCRMVATGNIVYDFGSGKKTGPNAVFFNASGGNVNLFANNLTPGWSNNYPSPSASAAAGAVSFVPGDTDAAGIVNFTVATTVTVKFTKPYDKPPVCIVGGPGAKTWTTTAGPVGAASLKIITSGSGSASYICGGQTGN